MTRVKPRRDGSASEDYSPSRADEAGDWGVEQPVERRECIGDWEGLVGTRCRTVLMTLAKGVHQEDCALHADGAEGA